jgi:hypothetical protein
MMFTQESRNMRRGAPRTLTGCYSPKIYRSGHNLVRITRPTQTHTFITLILYPVQNRIDCVYQPACKVSSFRLAPTRISNLVGRMGR